MQKLFLWIGRPSKRVRYNRLPNVPRFENLHSLVLKMLGCCSRMSGFLKSGTKNDESDVIGVDLAPGKNVLLLSCPLERLVAFLQLFSL